MADKTIYVAVWNTESGDEGVDGYFTEKPTEAQLYAYFRENYDYEFIVEEDGSESSYIYWKLLPLDEVTI